MRSATHTDGLRHSDICNLRFEPALSIKDLNSLVPLIGHVNVASSVSGDRMRNVELTGAGASRAPRQQEPAVSIELRDPRVRPVTIGNEDVPFAIECDVAWTDELIACTARARRGSRSA